MRGMRVNPGALAQGWLVAVLTCMIGLARTRKRGSAPVGWVGFGRTTCLSVFSFF